MYILILILLLQPLLAGPVSSDARLSARGTIDRCLTELKNGNPQIRRSAALVLGKYSQDPIARQGLLDCLQDEDAEIRQNALVSLTEGNFIRPEIKPHIYPLFQDPDVHIRRISTSLLRGLTMRRYGYFFGPFRSSSEEERRLNELARKHINLALKDSDYSVKRNILAGGIYRPDLIDSASLLPFLNDEKDELVILALQIHRYRPDRPGDRIRRLSRLAGHANPDIRRLVAQQLIMPGSFSSPDADPLPVLRRMLKDSSPKVRLTAVKGILLSGSTELLPQMEALLNDSLFSLEERCSLVPFLRQFGNSSLPLLQKLLKNPHPPLREEAMKVLADYPREHLDSGLLLEALNDENSSIRKQAVTLLRRRRHPFQPEQLRRLLCSPHEDLRESVLQLIPVTQNQLRQEAVLELCLDDSIRIRRQALDLLPSIRPQGWRDILIASLEDEDLRIQETAVRRLLPLTGRETLNALGNYLPRCRNSYLKREIQYKLQKHR